MRGVRGSRATAALFLAVLAATGCLVFRKPEVAFRGVEFGSVDASGASLNASFDVTNPNSYRIGVRQLTYRIRVNGRDAGGGAIEQETTLEPRSTTPVRLPLALDWSKVKLAGLDFLMMGGIEYAVEGDITFSTPVGVFRRPYSHSGRYSPLGGR
jgi:LEA14-like dessication related protein